MHTQFIIVFILVQFVFSCEKAFCSKEKANSYDFKVFQEFQNSFPEYQFEIDSCSVSELKLYTGKIDTPQLKSILMKLRKKNSVFKTIQVYSDGEHQFKLYPIYDDLSQTKIKDVGLLPIGRE